MEGLTKQLTNTLIALKKESARNMIQLSSIRDGSNTVSTLRDLKRAQGLVIVREAFTQAALSAATLAARTAWWTDVAPQLKPEDLPAQDTPISALPWPTGIIGNASFGYLFAQPEAVATMPSITLSSASGTTTITAAITISSAPCPYCDVMPLSCATIINPAILAVSDEIR